MKYSVITIIAGVLTIIQCDTHQEAESVLSQEKAFGNKCVIGVVESSDNPTITYDEYAAKYWACSAAPEMPDVQDLYDMVFPQIVEFRKELAEREEMEKAQTRRVSILTRIVTSNSYKRARSAARKRLLTRMD